VKHLAEGGEPDLWPGDTMVATATYTAQKWEAAWEEYVDALAAKDATFPNRYKPRHILTDKRACKRVRLAVETLREMDPEYFERSGNE
jgi:hypothetical protein